MLLLALLLITGQYEDLPEGASPATRALFKAVWAGDTAGVKRAVKQKGVDLNAYTKVGVDTALMLAANRGELEMVKALLAAGADPNLAPHRRYKTGPLAYAVMGRIDGGKEKSLETLNAVLRALLDGKADPNAELMMGEFQPRTTVTLLAVTLMPETLAVLLEGGGDPNRVQSDGKSGLDLAAGIKDEAEALTKLELLLKAGAKVPADEKKRLLLLVRALDHANVKVARALMAAGCTVSPSSDAASLLLAAAAATGDAAFYDELAKGVTCTGDVVSAALTGLKCDDASRRERVLGLAKRLQACGAGMKGASRAAALAGDATAFEWAAKLEKELPPTLLKDAAIGGDARIVSLLLVKGQSPDGDEGPLVTAAKRSQAEAVEAMWTKASPVTREAAVNAAAGAACASDKDLARIAQLFAVLARLHVETVPEKVRDCSPEGWLAFHAGRRDLEAAGEGTRELDALVFGGDAASAEGWESGATALLERAAPWVLPLGPYPRRVKSDTVKGMNPGFDVVLLGMCAPEQSASRLEALKGFYAGVYVKRVSAPVAELGCPLVLEQPLVSATKNGKVGADDVTASIVRRGRERTCVLVKLSPKGELASFASEAFDPKGCEGYDETVALDGCTWRCGGKTTRVRPRPGR